MNKLISILLAHLSTAVFFALLFTTTVPASTLNTPSILIIGDSLSAAYNMPQEAGWVSLLEQRLSERNFTFTVVNASIIGDTTAGGLSRLDKALRYAKPRLTIIELGGNDGLRGLPIDAMRNNLSEMITTAQASGSKVVLLGTQLPPNYGPQYTSDFSISFALLADKHHAALVPSMLKGFEDNLDYFQADQIHPSADAQNLILENVWPTIRSLLD
ncbi:MAG: arylesterase [Gammaproteobacteria bacterium]|nr:MAG: arylesterase [Gammaproteobacteria bacterium]